MKHLLMILLALLCSMARADIVFEQAPSAAGGIHKSSWYAPDGLDGDMYAYDSFTLAADTAITQIHWRGGYTNYLSGAGRAPVYAFTVSIYRSIAGGWQPDVGTGGRLARFNITGNAGETAVGTFGGVIMYDYAYTLSTPFQATAGVKYWVQIEASQGVTPTYYWPPDWGLCNSTGGNGSYFNKTTGGNYQNFSGDLAFSIWRSDATTVSIAASASPAGAGTITGAGSYPINSTALLQATANTGWGFVNWTQNGSQVSTNPRYSFTATTNRTLVANFVPAYTVTLGSLPTFAGTVSGGGIFNAGTEITVDAVSNPAFVFDGWYNYGTLVSNEASYTFTPVANMSLVAHFATDPLGAMFTFDDANVHTSLPASLSNNGVGVTFTGTGGSYSVQPVGSVGLSPAGFSGLMLYPNSVFPADLIADFSTNLSYFSMMYCPLELGCDDSSTIRATAYLNGVQVGTVTAQVPVPGTYPTGTVSISVPTGFDRVVVHYEAHPLRCQDWGPEFLADNVSVLRACGGASIAQHPIDTMLCAADTATFQVAAAGPGPFTYQWRHNGQPITNGPGGNGGTGVVNGADQPTLIITPIGASLTQADAGFYDCIVAAPGACELASLPALLTILESPFIIAQPTDLSTCPGSSADFFFELTGSDPMDVSWSHDGVQIDPMLNPSAATLQLFITPAGASSEGSYTCTASNACGSVMSLPVTLTVCIGDYNCDGGVDGSDIATFFGDWEAGVADVNDDGGVDGADVEYFFIRWEGGC